MPMVAGQRGMAALPVRTLTDRRDDFIMARPCRRGLQVAMRCSGNHGWPRPMTLWQKLFVAALVVAVAANYSKLCQATLGVLKESVGTVDLSRIDKALREYSVARIADAGAHGEGYYFPQDQEVFTRVVRESFEALGRDPAQDQWGNPFIYEPIDGGKVGYRLVSCGPDKQPGTEDDQWVERRGEKATMGTGRANAEAKLVPQAGASVAGTEPPAVANPGEPPPEDAPAPRIGKTAAAHRGTAPAPALSKADLRRATYLMRAGKNMALNRRYDKARQYYERVVASYPGSIMAKKAHAALGELQK